MSGYIVDNSAWTNAAQFDVANDALGALTDVIYSCPPQRLEFLYSARSKADYAERLEVLAATTLPVDEHDRVSDVSEQMQRALLDAGSLRAVGVVDLMIAAYAYIYRLTVVHYDSDFELLSDAFPGLMTQWLVPRGSLAELTQDD